MEIHLRDKGQLSRLDSLSDDAIMGWSIFDGDVFGAGEVALEIYDFEVLDIQREQVGLLLVDDGKFLADLDARKELLDLLFVQLHQNIVCKIIRSPCGRICRAGGVRADLRALLGRAGWGRARGCSALGPKGHRPAIMAPLFRWISAAGNFTINYPP